MVRRVKQFWTVTSLLFAGALGGCAKPVATSEVSKSKSNDNPKVAAAWAQKLPITDRVLVVANLRSPLSLKISQTYRQTRKIKKHLEVDCPTSEQSDESTIEKSVLTPVREMLLKYPEVGYVVLTKDIPIRIGDEGGYSVDGRIAGMFLGIKPIQQKAGQFEPDEFDLQQAVKRVRNPYFNSQKRFSRAETGMVLVTRLTGYDWADIEGLIRRSPKSDAKSAPILLDSQPQFGPESPRFDLNRQLERAAARLRTSGAAVIFDDQDQFRNSDSFLGGYMSWGSNDPSFNLETYRSLRFAPGALAETFVSTSGRTFDPNFKNTGQSLIADLIHQGATGAKGYVSEPFTFALCRPEILFDRQRKGFNLAESFYAASPVILWKDIVVGDPLTVLESVKDRP